MIIRPKLIYMIGDKAFKNFLENNRGVSLLELVVATAIFSVLILSSTGIFKIVIDGQRNALSAQNVQENVRYAMEKMSKEIRMAQASNTECLPEAVNKVFNAVDNGAELYFKNEDGQCINYYLENGRLKIMVNGAIADFVTPAKIEISNLKFSVIDDPIGAFHSVQPSVTMVMDIKALGQAMHEQKLKMQTTISSRHYE